MAVLIKVSIVIGVECLMLYRVRQSYPDETQDINAREQEIAKMWNTLAVFLAFL